MWRSVGITQFLSRMSHSRKHFYWKCINLKITKLSLIYLREPEKITKLLKQLLHLLRKWSITDSKPVPYLHVCKLIPRFWYNHLVRMNSENRRTILFQHSMLGRSLPAITNNSYLIQGYSEYVDRVSTPRPTTEKVVQLVKELAQDLELNLNPEKVGFKFHSPGASATYSREAGGFEREVREEYVKHVPKLAISSAKNILKKYVTNNKVISPSGIREILAYRVGARFLTNVGLSDRVRDFPFDWKDATARTVVLPELGGKLRIVQSCPIRQTFPAHLQRGRLEHNLKRHIAFREGLAPEQTFNLGKQPRLKSGKYPASLRFYSVDLSNATDLISREFLERICPFLGIELDHVRLTTAEYSSPVCKCKHTLNIKCGTNMGLPCSWVVLSTIHIAICDYVSRLRRTANCQYRVRGDDLVALWTQYQFDTYVSLMKQAGFEINLDKSFVSKDYALFCERLYKCTVNSEDEFVLTNCKKIISLKRFVKPPNQVELKGQKFSDHTTQIEEWIRSMNEWEVPWNFKRPFVSKMLDRAYKINPKFKDITFIPEVYGGLGLHRPNRPLTNSELTWLRHVPLDRKTSIFRTISNNSTGSIYHSRLLSGLEAMYFSPSFKDDGKTCNQVYNTIIGRISHSFDLILLGAGVTTEPSWKVSPKAINAFFSEILKRSGDNHLTFKTLKEVVEHCSHYHLLAKSSVKTSGLLVRGQGLYDT
nr:MAG: RNA-dependent RNA polymerase [Rhizoctonia solani narnavirus 13]